LKIVEGKKESLSAQFYKPNADKPTWMKKEIETSKLILGGSNGPLNIFSCGECGVGLNTSSSFE
jgi:hypothetical protein